MQRLFFIDPQSYNNLSIYDTSLLLCVESFDVHYYHNVKYQCEPLTTIHYHGVFSYSDKHGAMKALSYAASIVQVATDAVRLHPKTVHIQWFRLFQVDCLLVMFFHLLGIKIVYTAHNVMPHNPTTTDRKHFLWYYRHVDSIIVHTQRSKNELHNAFGISEDKINVIPHGIMPSPVKYEEVVGRMSELNHRLQLDGKVVFASMGFQNYYKGIDLITDAWASNPELYSNPKCELLVIGKVENADLGKLSEFSNVHIVNELVSDVDFDAYLRLASVALLPYRTISQSGVLLTAIQREVPVLVSDVGGLTDPLKYGNVGWCLGEPTVESLSKNMLNLIRNPEKIRECRDNKTEFAKVKEHFSWSKIGVATSRLYAVMIMLMSIFASVSAQDRNILWDMDALSQTARAKSSLQAKIKAGDDALSKPLLSVTAKQKCISGDIHNYESLAYYAWPDPDNPSGPYIEKDGQPSPEYKFYDGEKLTELNKRIVAMSEAYYLTKDRRYADRCIEQIKTWFLHSSTKMNPNFTHGQFIPGKRQNCGFTGAISEAYFFTNIMECLSMLKQDGLLKRKTDKKLRKWFSRLSDWLQTSSLGEEMHDVKDNHAVMYDVLLYRICMYTGDWHTCERIADEFATLRLDKQIAADGSQTLELMRTKAMMYSIYNLQHIVDFCQMLEYDGIHYYARHKEKIESAVTFIEQYINNQKSFPYKEIGDWSLYQRQFANLKKQLTRLRSK